jgi:hypothetical protein
MTGTARDQTKRKDAKAGGQLSALSSRGASPFVLRGRGTAGGFVVERRAAK